MIYNIGDILDRRRLEGDKEIVCYFPSCHWAYCYFYDLLIKNIRIITLWQKALGNDLKLYFTAFNKRLKKGVNALLLSILTTAASPGQEIPPVLPLLLGFLLALVILNLGLSMFRKKGQGQRKNSSQTNEKK
ncbi:hypothetical protein [Anaerotignum sp.]|uniref:hypothetical protein n=1 Tax=Anaerotignum sp. TaxID=2039241 RepID=UPI00289D8855|nr:hypothetical protein [Anaerotignum sp.]